MSRTAYVFFVLLLVLVFLLYIYQTNSARGVVKLRPKNKSGKKLAQVQDASFSVDLSSGIGMSSSGQSLDSSVDFKTFVQMNMSKGEEGPTQVIVLARMRTGSTLCGEILNQNPDLFFIFEPLHSLKGLRFSLDSEFAYEDYEDACTDLLKKLYKCKFPRMFIQSLARWGIGKGKSKGILPICRRTDGCKKASPSDFQRKCSASGHVATKTIRADIKMLRPLVKVHDINLKIVHLIRDPRGTANSRRSYYSPKRRRNPGVVHHEKSLQELGLLSASPDSHKNTVPMLCKWMKETVNDALERPDWLKDRYKLVRYEDLAQDPLRLSQVIYKFVGLEMPQVVVQWIQDNTESDNFSSNRQFSTHKNSSQASTSWRGKLSLEDVLAVQDICGDVMSSLGYRQIRTQEELDNYSIPVVEPIDLGKDIMIA